MSLTRSQLRPDQLNPANEKQAHINLMRAQNDKMKAELKLLTEKLEQFVEKSRQRKNDQFPVGLGKNELDKDEEIMAKEIELKSSQHKVQYYKREIENMRRQLEGSYNIQKIIALEDEQKNKERILKQLQDESESLLKVQREQEKALKALNKEGEYDTKIGELGEELRVAKETLRKLQFKQREDEKLMKSQHEQLVVLEEKCRKMRMFMQLAKNQTTQSKSKQLAVTVDKKPKPADDKVYTAEDLADLKQQLKDAELEKIQDEKRLRAQVKEQEDILKAQQQELALLEQRTKEKEQEYRLNEFKIRDIQRQLPQRALKPLMQKQTNKLSISQSMQVLQAPPKRNLPLAQSQSVAQLKDSGREQLPPAFPKSRPPKQVTRSPQAEIKQQKLNEDIAQESINQYKEENSYDLNDFQD